MLYRSHKFVVNRAVEAFGKREIFHRWRRFLELGAEKADSFIWRLFNPGLAIGMPFHVYNPVTRRGYWFFQDAKDKGVKFFNRAVRFYKRGRFSESFILLGQCLHSIADLTIPAHSKVINHFLDSDDLENYMESSLNNFKIKIRKMKRMNIADFFEDVAKKSYKLECKENGFWIGIKYWLFKIKDKLPEPELRRQSRFALNNAVNYSLGVLSLFHNEIKK